MMYFFSIDMYACRALRKFILYNAGLEFNLTDELHAVARRAYISIENIHHTTSNPHVGIHGQTN